MPELPEVETTVRVLRELIIGKPITQVTILPKGEKLLGGKGINDFTESLIGKKFQQIGRQGKFVVLETEKPHSSRLIIHLRMTGRFLFQTSQLKPKQLIKLPTLLNGEGQENHHRVQPESQLHSELLQNIPEQGNYPDPYTRAVLQFSDEILYFSDKRRFATWHLLTEEEAYPGLANLGIDALSAELTSQYFQKTASHSKKNSYQFLLDQTKIAGIGNIYANEALYLAKIAPTRPVYSLNLSEIDNLLSSIRKVLLEAIEAQGTSLSDYRTPLGESGQFQQQLNVYSQKSVQFAGKNYPVQKLRIGGRSVWWVPELQK